jgi:hypothetical protein
MADARAGARADNRLAAAGDGDNDVFFRKDTG